MTRAAPRTEAGRRMLDEFPAYNEGRSFGTHWPLHSILAIEREAAAAPPEPPRPDPMRAARFVLDYWLTEYLRAVREGYTKFGIGTHPLALVQAAMDGETEPAQLGLPDDLHEAFRTHLAVPVAAPEGLSLDVERLTEVIHWHYCQSKPFRYCGLTLAHEQLARTLADGYEGASGRSGSPGEDR